MKFMEWLRHDPASYYLIGYWAVLVSIAAFGIWWSAGVESKQPISIEEVPRINSQEYFKVFKDGNEVGIYMVDESPTGTLWLRRREQHNTDFPLEPISTKEIK